MKQNFITLSIITLIIINLTACKDMAKKEIEDRNSYLQENNITEEPQQSGLYYVETVAGTGDAPIIGKTVKVHYEGKYLNGKVFDSSFERNEPIEFQLGVGQVIKGWDEGISLMKKGGKATLVIPSHLGYGPNDYGPIPGYSTLVFTVELLD